MGFPQSQVRVTWIVTFPWQEHWHGKPDGTRLMDSSVWSEAALQTSDVVVPRVSSVVPEPVPTSGNLGPPSLVPPSGAGGVLMDPSY